MRYGFDPLLISAQVFVESSFRADAVSRVGALGLMQIMPATSEWLGTSPNKLLDPETNIALGVYYDYWLYNRLVRLTKMKGIEETRKRIYGKAENPSRSTGHTDSPKSLFGKYRIILMLGAYHDGIGNIRRRFDEYGTFPAVPYFTNIGLLYYLRIFRRWYWYRSFLR